MGTWAYQTKLDGVEALIAQFDGAPKALKAALKRAGRKSMTKVMKVMRDKVPNNKKKFKRERKATVKESLKIVASGVFRTLAQKVLGAKKRKGKIKKFYQRDFQTGTTGMLKKSIGSKVGVNRKTGQVYAMAGPRRKKEMPEVKAFNPWTQKMVRVIPSKYAHLVERGFNLKIRGRVVKRIPGQPFLRPSFDEAKGQINEETKAALDLELAKLFAAKTAAAAKAAAKAMESAGGAD
jgi:hypothetical protein